MRPTLSALMIASLLTCPLWCAGGSWCAGESSAVGEVFAAASPENCCTRCESNRSSTRPTSKSSAPESSCPCEDCQCLACICNGAVVESDACPDNVRFLEPWGTDRTTSSEDLGGRRPGFASPDGISFAFAFFNGRAARIALRSLLI